MRKMALTLGFLLAVVVTSIGSIYTFSWQQSGPEISTSCVSEGRSRTRPSDDYRGDIDTIRRFLNDQPKVFNLRHVEKTCISRFWDKANGSLRCYLLELHGVDPLNRSAWEMCLTPRGDFFSLRASG